MAPTILPTVIPTIVSLANKTQEVPFVIPGYMLSLIQYLISPLVVCSIFIFILIKFFKLGSISQKFNSALEDISTLKNDSKKLIGDLGIIKTHCVNNLGLNAQLFSSNSPLMLQPKGIAILEKSNFKNIYKENKKWIIEEMNKVYRVKDMAEIDMASYKIMESLKSSKKLKGFKLIAYDNGITLDVLMTICAIFLRNEVGKEMGFEK